MKKSASQEENPYFVTHLLSAHCEIEERWLVEFQTLFSKVGKSDFRLTNKKRRRETDK